MKLIGECDYMDPGLCKNCTYVKAHENGVAGTDSHLLHSHTELGRCNFKEMKTLIMFLSNIILNSKHDRTLLCAHWKTLGFIKGLCLRTDPSAALANSCRAKKPYKPVPYCLASPGKMSPNQLSFSPFCCVITTELHTYCITCMESQKKD